MKRVICWTGLFIFLTNSFKSEAQASAVPEAHIKLSKWFDDQIGKENNGLYSGPIYLMNSSSRFTHQFFSSKLWMNGNIQIEDNWYFDVPLVFDVEKELVIVRHPDLGRRDGISIDMEKVVSFEFEGHHFSRLPASNSYGFYEILYKGSNYDMVAKRQKAEKTTENGIEHEIKDTFYLNVNEEIIQIKKKNLNILYPQSPRLIREISIENGVKLKFSDEERLITFMKLFDQKIDE